MSSDIQFLLQRFHAGACIVWRYVWQHPGALVEPAIWIINIPIAAGLITCDLVTPAFGAIAVAMLGLVSLNALRSTRQVWQRAVATEVTALYTAMRISTVSMGNLLNEIEGSCPPRHPENLTRTIPRPIPAQSRASTATNQSTGGIHARH